MKDREDLEKYRQENEQYGRRICLRIKNMKKQENESSDKVLEAGVRLVGQVLIFQMPALVVQSYYQN